MKVYLVIKCSLEWEEIVEGVFKNKTDAMLSIQHKDSSFDYIIQEHNLIETFIKLDGAH